MPAKQLITRAQAATLYVATGVNVDSGSVAYSVTKENGSSLVSGTATNVTTGVYKFTLAAQSSLDLLTVAWSGTFSGATRTFRTVAEIVGAEVATVAEIRSMETELADAAKFPDDAIQLSLNHALDAFGRYLGFDLVPRYRRDTLDGYKSNTIKLARQHVNTITSATVDGSTVSTATWVTSPSGLIRDTNYGFTYGVGNVVVTYEAGLLSIPGDLHWAYTQYVRYLLIHAKSRVDDRATSMSDGEMTFSLAQAGRNRLTGIPVVDEVLNAYRSSAQAVAY
jgi:hypothetical protein